MCHFTKLWLNEYITVENLCIFKVFYHLSKVVCPIFQAATSFSPFCPHIWDKMDVTKGLHLSSYVNMVAWIVVVVYCIFDAQWWILISWLPDNKSLNSLLMVHYMFLSTGDCVCNYKLSNNIWKGQYILCCYKQVVSLRSMMLRLAVRN
jgi:hypothetical protein